MRPWLLGIAVTLAAAGVAAADEKAEAVVKKAIEAHGGADNLNKNTFSRFTMKGEISILGMEAEFSGDTASGPDKMRMNMNLTIMGFSSRSTRSSTATRGSARSRSATRP
jgi:hypothetical protein